MIPSAWPTPCRRPPWLRPRSPGVSPTPGGPPRTPQRRFGPLLLQQQQEVGIRRRVRTLVVQQGGRLERGLVRDRLAVALQCLGQLQLGAWPLAHGCSFAPRRQRLYRPDHRRSVPSRCPHFFIPLLLV